MIERAESEIFWVFLFDPRVLQPLMSIFSGAPLVSGSIPANVSNPMCVLA